MRFIEKRFIYLSAFYPVGKNVDMTWNGSKSVYFNSFKTNLYKMEKNSCFAKLY